ncbi:hypothetical protein [Bradyrhizobium vignae]|uniref:Uncharacterized protein n=1 Tax=Bradyrhizobium vignae TaxID=1549949 RepID=A0A2U3PW31_9BRAD|nr:hypothetical protein [Bradyrhizobium vignae]SPP93329.1 exported protein of unknown function [Bradyrhizobium vignae]
MRRSIALLLLLACAVPAGAAPPSSCAAKFIGDWRHSGSGNRGTITPDGRALCSEHPSCVQGTWTCSGNVLTYTNSLGSWNYTLAPDGKSMSTNGGAAVATRIGAVPASARAKDSGSAVNNVAADVLGIDRTPSPAPDAPPPAAALPAKPSPAEDDPAKAAAARYARTLFSAGQAAARVAGQSGGGPADWSTSEDRFREAALEFRKAGDARNEKIALKNADVARRESAKPPHRLVQAPNARKSPSAKYSLRCKMYEKQLEANADDARTAELLAKLRSEHRDAGC